MFRSGYWGHPEYKLPPKANLLAVAYYIEALDFQREFIRLHAVLGGKNPHPQTYLVGGMASAVDPNEPHVPINLERITFMQQVAQAAETFVNEVYLPDVLAIAVFYREWFGRGEGLGNLITYGDYPVETNAKRFFLPRGVILNRDLSHVHPMDPKNVAEYVAHSYYESGGGTSKHPAESETTRSV